MLSLRQASRTLLIRATNSQTQQPGRNFKNALTRNLVIQHSSLSTTTGSGGSSSTVSKGPWGWITSKLADREKEKQEKQFRDQLVRMAASEQWTLKDFGKDLDLTLKGWQMYIPGLKDTKEFKTARTAQVAVKAIGDEIGLEGSCDEVKKLGRTEKLRISFKSGLSVEDVNLMVQQFEIVDLMHKILRYRVKAGKPIPVDQAGMQAAMQSDAKLAFNTATKKALMAKRNPYGRRAKQSTCKKVS